MKPLHSLPLIVLPFVVHETVLAVYGVLTINVQVRVMLRLRGDLRLPSATFLSLFRYRSSLDFLELAVQ